MSRPTSFRIHIRRMFRQEDVDQMNAISSFDLSKYEDVKLWAERIVARLESPDQTRVMPPPPPAGSGPWPIEWIELFKRWISEGCPE